MDQTLGQCSRIHLKQGPPRNVGARPSRLSSKLVFAPKVRQNHFSKESLPNDFMETVFGNFEGDTSFSTNLFPSKSCSKLIAEHTL